ncbi:MAG TPA: hypothetical protein OIM60_07290 [Clostridiaceae bacterium]|nr:hypothetical protein [Clostridiaceae bacterium]
MMKKLNYILIIICIIGVIFSFSLFSKEGYAININSKNRNLVSKSLSGEIKNTDDVTKIILGQGWHSGKLTIYHSYGKKDTLYITEGMFNLGELEKYIRENGYNLDNIGFASIGVSGLILIYLLIYRYVNKDKS